MRSKELICISLYATIQRREKLKTGWIREYIKNRRVGEELAILDDICQSRYLFLDSENRKWIKDYVNKQCSKNCKLKEEIYDRYSSLAGGKYFQEYAYLFYLITMMNTGDDGLKVLEQCEQLRQKLAEDIYIAFVGIKVRKFFITYTELIGLVLLIGHIVSILSIIKVV